MTHPVVVIRVVESVGRIYEILTTTAHNGFPVVDDFDPSLIDQERFGLLKGTILRHQLITMLRKKCFAHRDMLLTTEDFRESYPRYPTIDSVQLSDEEKQCELDLTPYLNFSPYSLNENSNLPRVFKLFRGLGLRHIVIVDQNNYVVGIVTRIDIARYKAHIGFNDAKIKELHVTT